MLKGFPRRSYYGKDDYKPAPVKPASAPKKQIDSFEAEYQKFIDDLKAKKEAEVKKEEPAPVVEEPKAEVIPETVTTVAEDAPILNEETQQKKTKKKKAKVETVAEPTIDGLD